MIERQGLVGIRPAVVDKTCVWGAEQLGDDHRGYLAALPLTAEVDLGEAGLMLAFHGSPRSFEDIISPTTPAEELDTMLLGAAHSYLAGGHTHVPMVRRHGTQTIVNPGSVGMPFAEYGVAGAIRVLPRADYGILEAADGRVGIELRSVAVDEEELALAAATNAMPHADWWLGLWKRK